MELLMGGVVGLEAVLAAKVAIDAEFLAFRTGQVAGDRIGASRRRTLAPVVVVERGIHLTVELLTQHDKDDPWGTNKGKSRGEDAARIGLPLMTNAEESRP